MAIFYYLLALGIVLFLLITGVFFISRVNNIVWRVMCLLMILWAIFFGLLFMLTALGISFTQSIFRNIFIGLSLGILVIVPIARKVKKW